MMSQALIVAMAARVASANQSRTSIFSSRCPPRLRPNERRSALRQVELPIALMKVSGVEATRIDEIKS
jgi:hypothetical protein